MFSIASSTSNSWDMEFEVLKVLGRRVAYVGKTSSNIKMDVDFFERTVQHKKTPNKCEFLIMKQCNSCSMVCVYSNLGLRFFRYSQLVDLHDIC